MNFNDRKRLLKKTGFLVSEIGFGAWGIGGKGVGSQTAIDASNTITAYLESGGNFIDTAISYGDSEKLIGQTLKELGCSSEVYICTKSKNGETEETIKDLRRDLETSLRNLQREYIDIYYLHMPPEQTDVIDHALDELEKFKKEGKIRGIGASIKGPAVREKTVDLTKRYIDTNRVDVIELVYSILRQRHYESIRYAFEKDVGIVVRTSLESGFLTGKYSIGTRFPADDHRSRWNAKVDIICEKVEKLRNQFTSEKYPDMSHLAILFALNPPEVTSVIVGAKNPDQLKANMQTLLMEPLSERTIELLRKECWDFLEYANPDI